MTFEELKTLAESEYGTIFKTVEYGGRKYLENDEKGNKLTISLSNYSFGENKQFIAVNCWNKKELSGFGHPCDTWEKAKHSIELVLPKAVQCTLF